MEEFEGVVAVVTGGGRGIGAATVQLLADKGASVAVLDRNLSGVPERVLGVVSDISDDRAVSDGMAKVAEHYGGLDVLINNAGVGAVGDVTQNSDAEWCDVLNVNVIGAVRACRAALPLLRRSSKAAIVNVCSAVAFVGVRERALYSASKGGLLGLTIAMAADHVGDGIRVNAVAPGTTETAWIDRLLENADDKVAARDSLRARQPLGRFVTRDEVAHAIVSLASPFAGATTGAVLRVDGGMTTLRV